MTKIDPTAFQGLSMAAIGYHEYDLVTGGDKDPSGATRSRGLDHRDKSSLI